MKKNQCNTLFILFVFGIIPMTLFGEQAAQLFLPVNNFDVNKYLGTWYEIVRYPHSFEKDLNKVTAIYTKQNNGNIKVENSGIKNGKRSIAIGKAKFASDPSKGHLKVSFFWFFYADYIIVDLDSNYSHAIVVSNSSKYLWILSRTPTLDTAILDQLVLKAEAMGFKRETMIFVSQ